jgi:hypothetical protein
VGVAPTGSACSLLGALGLRPVRARLAVSTGSGGDGMRESELLGRLRQCCLRAGSALVPPGEGASAAVAALLPAANAGGGRSSGGKGSKGSKGKQAGGDAAAAAAAVEEGANAAMGGFAEVAVLLSQTPAPGYGSPAVQVRGTSEPQRSTRSQPLAYANPAADSLRITRCRYHSTTLFCWHACCSSAVLPLCVHASLCSQCRWNGGRLEPPQRWRRQLSHYLWTCSASAPRLRPPRQRNYAK